MTTATVSDLNQQLADDTDGAFPDLVRTFQDGVYSGALQLTRNDHDAQDVTQETFVRVYRALQRYDDARIRALELRPWIWTIALNLCRNRARARARRPEVSDLVDRERITVWYSVPYLLEQLQARGDIVVKTLLRIVDNQFAREIDTV